MDYNELYNKYMKLLEENKILKIENGDFRKRLELQTKEVCLDNEYKAISEIKDNISIQKNELETYIGKPIRVEFNGKLREEQVVAVDAMLKYDNGVLSATTAFGKTVIGAKLIAERKVNTLIIVHTQQLLEQWKERLKRFYLEFEYTYKGT